MFGRGLIAAWVILLAAFIAANANAGNGGEKAPPKIPGLWEGRPFLDARADLLKRGWMPFESHELDRTGRPYNRSYGMESEHYHSGIIEVQKCSQGQVYCRFNYTRGKECLLLITKGERDPRVHLWSDACFEPLNK